MSIYMYIYTAESVMLLENNIVLSILNIIHNWKITLDFRIQSQSTDV